MSDLQTQMAILETKMQQISKQVDEGFKANSEEHKEIMERFAEAIKTKADKDVVDELRANQSRIVWIVITSVVLALLGLILKP